MPSRYLIGIDLGTTNSVLAYIDTQEVADLASSIRVFPVPQLVAAGEVRALTALPSFLYFPTDEELAGGGVVANWNEQPAMVTGVLAREQGALVPRRQVSSAKSWLSYPGVHRQARILPAQAEGQQPRISPVEASARYLMHLRDAWNDAIGTEDDTRFERQEIVLTVPGSFDEEARELTVEAARMAKIENLTLLEEPLAALYAWIAANPRATSGGGSSAGGGEVRDGELILICDIGGGTSDFSLVRARVQDELQLERIAIGEHLLLGGDNLDLALARHVESKMKDAKLSLRQRYALRRTCCAAKERLLTDSSLRSVTVSILGSGRAVVGQARSTELSRDEVVQTLTDGFLPITRPDEMPTATTRQAGLRELGLPYASDAAITRHLAAFLTRAAADADAAGPAATPRLARPDAVLFNGGFCAPAMARDRMIDAISAWFGGAQSGWRPSVLNNEAYDSAVARGAAYYGRVRRGMGLRIRAGNARSYYVGLPAEQGVQGICVLPAGVEEGTTLPLLNREFSVLANRPVSFTLYSSRNQHSTHGEIAALDEANVHRHPPLGALLRYGKKLRDVYLNIRLRASFTEVGTLEIWCESRDTPHRWRLQFELREEEAQAEQTAVVESKRAPRSASVVAAADSAVESAVRLIRRVFGACSGEPALSPDALVAEMEAALGVKRDSWPLDVARRLGDALIECAEGHKKSPGHDMRWLNLSGFCLRPGFGAPGDDARAKKLRAIALNPAFQDHLQSQVASLALLRRIAGGINASEQQSLYKKYAGFSDRKRKRLNRQIDYETWRLIASLDHVLGGTRALLGKELLAKLARDPGDAIWLWSLGRLGARIPLYGPLHCVVPADAAGEWITTLLELPMFTPVTAAAIAMIGRRTNDRSRDIDEGIREQVISRFGAFGIGEDVVQVVAKYVPPERGDAVRSFGESLPPGLSLVSSSDCLLSVPAFHGSGLTISQPA